ncbi:hypothetical protein K8089_03430 [Aequorivita sp. F47161]|uniref:DUF2178 domain-containing protein n=1 Tax=Aequorivita vitellina TaxID=2874475 RepID=A0A9X1QRM2_9FLAO|nr:hypothetical protein [Aequorivita vitellina]MCG2418061.1 hypothetical protein [Aequorivita vitellina]
MKTEQSEWRTSTKKNTRHLGYWAAAWVVSMAVASFGHIYFWKDNTVLTILFIAINTAIGVGMILMNRKYNNNLDEMQRKVSMDAMAVALGVGIVGGLSYSLLDQANVIAFHADISHLVMLIGLTYIIAIFVGTNRYK